jgi:hypothetical protein
MDERCVNARAFGLVGAWFRLASGPGLAIEGRIQL